MLTLAFLAVRDAVEIKTRDASRSAVVRLSVHSGQTQYFPVSHRFAPVSKPLLTHGEDMSHGKEKLMIVRLSLKAGMRLQVDPPFSADRLN